MKLQVQRLAQESGLQAYAAAQRTPGGLRRRHALRTDRIER